MHYSRMQTGLHFFLEENVRRVVVDEAFIIIPFARNTLLYKYDSFFLKPCFFSKSFLFSYILMPEVQEIFFCNCTCSSTTSTVIKA